MVLLKFEELEPLADWFADRPAGGRGRVKIVRRLRRT
jgi:hypothetical protein